MQVFEMPTSPCWSQRLPSAHSHQARARLSQCCQCQSCPHRAVQWEQLSSELVQEARADSQHERSSTAQLQVRSAAAALVWP